MTPRELVPVIAALGVGAVGAGLGVFFGRRRPAPPVHGVTPKSAAAGRTLLGRTLLGRYRIDRELGRGAMGTVHLGHDLHRGTPVAIKTLVLPAPSDDHDAAGPRARFIAEARAARKLRHPDIVTVVDAGEDAGIAFIVMEVLRGTDLVAHTRTGSLLPVATVLEAVARIALALAHAHRLGVVHRDVKPANLVFDRETGDVKVTDFGIASVADAERTRTGVLLGTPFYMSPEQMAGGRVDGRSDLYSLGVVLHELLTGALPYRDGPPAELLRQIADAPAPRLRERRPDLPAALDDIVALALQKRPGLRYGDGAAFAADLREVARRMRFDPKPDVP